ncbi:CHAT domain-containing protein [Microbispora hainanensis]|nr:CHAT domain-containing protein [Microbispora hainanensis]
MIRVTVEVTETTVTVKHGDQQLVPPYQLRLDDKPTEVLARLLSDAPCPGDMVAYGRWLYRALLAESWPTIRELGPEIELALAFDRFFLHGEVWEAMCGDDGKPLSADACRLVAYTRLITSQTAAPVTVRHPPRLLFAIGASLTDAVIRPGAMFVGLLKGFAHEGSCVTRVLQGARLDDLERVCSDFKPDLVHLVAHGDVDVEGNPVVRLKDRAYGATHLGKAFGSVPKLLVLSSCRSGQPGSYLPLAAELVTDGIPIVVAMSGDVSEKACRLFVRRFTEAVHLGLPISRAAAEGRHAALLHSECEEGLDWAFPTIFMAPSVEPGFRLVDPEPGQRINELTRFLELHKPPVFIGRGDILRVTDHLFSPVPAERLGMVVSWTSGSIKGEGGTRLLREIGLRLLRAGHLPLMLGPYKSGGFWSRPPDDLRQLIYQIFRQAYRVADFLDLPLTGLHLLRDPLEEGLAEFRDGTQPLDTDVARRRLAKDLERFTHVLSGAGDPFGPSTRVAVLAENIHEWRVLRDLLAMVETTGLGTRTCPVPVVATGSLNDANGRMLKSFLETHRGPGYAFPELTRLSSAEAALEFQWVLLHPWKEDHRMVYVAKRGVKLEDWAFEALQGRPTEVDGGLYGIAKLHKNYGRLTEDDDAAAWDAYVSRRQ